MRGDYSLIAVWSPATIRFNPLIAAVSTSADKSGASLTVTDGSNRRSQAGDAERQAAAAGWRRLDGRLLAAGGRDRSSTQRPSVRPARHTGVPRDPVRGVPAVAAAVARVPGRVKRDGDATADVRHCTDER